MARVYVHLSSRDIDNKILAVDGVKPEEEPEADPMAAQICPRCKKANSADAMYCDRCSMALNDEALKNISVLQDAKEDPDRIIEYGQWLKSRKGTTADKK
jgi:uncharacterized paraquat-inducible protein A